MSEPPEIPKPRFQAAPQTIGKDEKRKPLPRHIVKEILDASNARLRSRHPLLLEMQARCRARRACISSSSVCHSVREMRA